MVYAQWYIEGEKIGTKCRLRVVMHWSFPFRGMDFKEEEERLENSKEKEIKDIFQDVHIENRIKMINMNLVANNLFF